MIDCDLEDDNEDDDILDELAGDILNGGQGADWASCAAVAGGYPLASAFDFVAQSVLVWKLEIKELKRVHRGRRSEGLCRIRP